MNNKICEKCRQTNLPNAKTCTKCGLELSQNDSWKEDPLKTIAVGQQEFNEIISVESDQAEPFAFSSEANSPKNETNSSETEKKSNSKLYWILGGVGALVLIGGFLVFVLGIGAYLYSTSRGDDEETAVSKNVNSDEDNENNEKKSSKIEVKETSSNDANEPTTATGKQILGMLKSDYAAFGKFKLIGTNVKELMTFDRAAETIIGNYSEQGTSDEVVHSYSYYTSWITAKSQATEKFNKFKKDDRRATLKSRKDSLIGVFTVADRQYYMECSSIKTQGLCQLASSSNPKQLRRYINVRYK